MGSPKGDNIGNVGPEKHTEKTGKAAEEGVNQAWSKGADTKIAANPAQPKQEEHGFLNIDFKGLGDGFNQALHNAKDAISNIGKPSPEQIAADQAKAAREQADKAAESTAQNIYDRLFNKQLSYDSTLGDINKQLKDMDGPTRQAVLEHLKKKEGMLSPLHVDKKDGDYVVTWGGGLGAQPEHVYP